MKLNGNGLGLTLGIIWGGTVFLATMILVVKASIGLHYVPAVGVGPTLGKLGQFYMGYSVTAIGSFVGFAYGFVHAYVTGQIVAFLYNRFSGEK